MSPSMSPPAASAVSTTFAPAFEPTPAPVVLALNRQPSPDARDPCTQLEVILGSVMTWSMGKLEAAAPGVMTTDPMSRYLASPNRPPAQDSRTMYRTFELVFDLWARGQGHLAGLAARRGFRSLEYVLTEDHPDLVWHMLDTIYDMVDKGHLQLLALFLDHAAAISDHCLPGQHPLRRILAQLRRSDYRSPRGRQHVCHVLRQAWLRNVDILGSQIADSSSSSSPYPGSSSDFSPSGSSSTSSALASSRYLWLYEQLIWDARTRLRKGSGLDKRAGDMAAALQALSRTIAAAEAVDTCEKLRVQALMLEFTQMDLGDRAAAHGLALALLRDSDSSRSDARSAARFQAYARKMLSRLDAHGCRWDDAEDNLRLAVRKREAAHGTTNDIRVVRDMWVLAAYYERLGRRGEAQKVAGDAIERATVWLNDAVPNDGL